MSRVKGLSPWSKGWPKTIHVPYAGGERDPRPEYKVVPLSDAEKEIERLRHGFTEIRKLYLDPRISPVSKCNAMMNVAREALSPRQEGE